MNNYIIRFYSFTFCEIISRNEGSVNLYVNKISCKFWNNLLDNMIHLITDYTI